MIRRLRFRSATSSAIRSAPHAADVTSARAELDEQLTHAGRDLGDVLGRKAPLGCTWGIDPPAGRATTMPVGSSGFPGFQEVVLQKTQLRENPLAALLWKPELHQAFEKQELGLH